MKALIAILTTCLYLVICACCAKEKCESTSLLSTLQGEWTVHINDQEIGSVAFLSDSILIDHLHLVSESERDGELLPVTTYYTLGNDVFVTKASTENGELSGGRNYFVTDYTCSAITAYYGTLQVRFTR